MKWLAKLIGGLFYGVGFLAALVLFFFYWQVVTHWLGGFLGTVAAILVAPGAVVFPLVYWLVQGVFPTYYFELLGVSIGSIAIAEFIWSSGGDD